MDPEHMERLKRRVVQPAMQRELYAALRDTHELAALVFDMLTALPPSMRNKKQEAAMDKVLGRALDALEKYERQTK